MVVCADQNHFYQSSIFVTGSGSLTGASVSASIDGGQTFVDPVAAVLKDGSYHFVDKPWMAQGNSRKARKGKKT